MSRGDLEATLEWMTDDDDPVIVVTQGSFMGLRATERWRRTLAAVLAQGVRALLVGATTARLSVDDYDSCRVRASAFLPLSRVLEHASVSIHHGGVGTTFSALRAGVPAVVIPQAFDQSYSAGLVEDAGVGYDATLHGLAPALSEALTNTGLGARSRTLARTLINPRSAAVSAAQRILGTTASS